MTDVVLPIVDLDVFLAQGERDEAALAECRKVGPPLAASRCDLG